MTHHLLALMELFNRLNSKRPLYYRLELRFNGVDWAASVVEVDGAFEQVGIIAKGFGCSIEDACERALYSHTQMDAYGRLSMDEAEKLVAVATRMAQEASLTPQQL